MTPTKQQKREKDLFNPANLKEVVDHAMRESNRKQKAYFDEAFSPTKEQTLRSKVLDLINSTLTIHAEPEEFTDQLLTLFKKEMMSILKDEKHTQYCEELEIHCVCVSEARNSLRSQLRQEVKERMGV